MSLPVDEDKFKATTNCDKTFLRKVCAASMVYLTTLPLSTSKDADDIMVLYSCSNVLHRTPAGKTFMLSAAMQSYA